MRTCVNRLVDPELTGSDAALGAVRAPVLIHVVVLIHVNPQVPVTRKRLVAFFAAESKITSTNHHIKDSNFVDPDRSALPPP